MKERFYQAFTLVEMLIVMGILIILMVIGVSAGRYAINRANRVAHQNAADQIYQALQAYYTENRQFPEVATVDTMMAEDGALHEFMEGEFNGGNPATYHYFVGTGESTLRQSVLVCVTLGGIEDELERGVYCSGNGFRDEELPIGTENASILTQSFFDSETFAGEDTNYYTTITALPGADWNGNDWGVEAEEEPEEQI
jgi:type II secretory pathway pseudopilin PulG